MLARRITRLPASGDWRWGKHDGYRLLADTAPPAPTTPTLARGRRLAPASVHLRSRYNADVTGWFPELHAPLRALAGGRHVLDGEVTVLDARGVSHFDRLHARALRRGWVAGADLTTYCVFDLLVHDGADIRTRPLEERRARLRALVATVPALLFVDDTPDPAALWALVLALRLEGMVGKRVGSPYTAGAGGDWVKLKRPGAIAPGRFRREP